MPIYEYECPLCGVFEAVQKATDKPLKADPGCTNDKCPRKAKRILSASAFHLKGTGWYKTDYASSSSSGGGKSTKASSASTDSSSSTETKSSTKDSSKKGPKSGGGSCGSGCGCH